MLVFIIIMVLLVVLIWLYIKFRKPKKATLLCYGGTLGGGKTFNGTADILKFYRKSVRKWKRINKPFSLLDVIPYFKKKRLHSEYYGLDKPLLYSNYPILIGYKKGKPILSETIDNDIMFLRKSIPLGSQVIIDEFSSWIDQFEYNEVFSETLNDHIQKWRHYHGNGSHLIVIDQATNNIPLQVRRRLNEAIICNQTKHYLKFIHITEYKCIQLCDDIKSVEVIDNDESDTDDKILRIIRFSLTRRYDDRAYSNRYWYVDNNESNCKIMPSFLKCLFSIKKPMPKEKYPILDIEIDKKLKADTLKDTKEKAPQD